MNSFDQIKQVLHTKATLQARLNLIPYDGTPEIKENTSGKYLYIRKRINGKLTSTYVGQYSDDLYQLLLRNSKEARELKKQIRNIDKELLSLGYIKSDLSPDVLRNLEFARANMKSSIFDQAILEGVATTFPQTETIIENGTVNGMTVSDIQKILNLKHAWEFILDIDILNSSSDLYLLSNIARLVNEGFFIYGGMLRDVPVTIGGSTYKPSLPIEADIKDDIKHIVTSQKEAIDIAIELCMYCMKKQIFIDGNKRASIIFANHYLISKGGGLLVIPEKHVAEFKKKLISYYENDTFEDIKNFLKEKCWKAL